MTAWFWTSVASFALLVAPPDYQPASNLTRGIYADVRGAISTSVWEPWVDYAVDRVERHAGEASIRCVNEAGGKGSGVGQMLVLNQTEPKPIRIAGWSKARDVATGAGWQYSLYVDLTYSDGESWPMQLAAFRPGTHDWELSETVLTPRKPVRQARFHAFLRNLAGTVWFDDLYFGEVGGPNLLRAPGFEGDLRDLTARTRLFDTLADLHCNALHTYLPGTSPLLATPDDPANELRRFLDEAHERGLGVWLTLGVGTRPFKDADDPNYPAFYCPNEAWGDDWVAALERAARFPFAGLSMVPDEYVYSNDHLQDFAKHADPRVAKFYQEMGAYCSGPGCRERYRQRFGADLPPVTGRPKSCAEPYRNWIESRYDTTTAWLKRGVTAIKALNPTLRADSLICVTPLCTDWWYGPGIAWDRAGYEAGLEYPTTDPYILLHNYLGDSNHWYVTETAEHLAGASPARRCGVVLEASRLRNTDRELDPPEVYGSAFSAIWHGARELAWWHLSHLTNVSKTTEHADRSYAWVKGAYNLLGRIDGWFGDDRPQPGVAVLFSRASCDWWRLYAEAADRPAGLLPGDPPDPRHASLAQKELLSFLWRQGYPATLYYLESVRAAELADYRTIVVPFPFALSDDRVALLRELAAAGQRVILVGETGRLDEHGAIRAKPALAELIGPREAGSSAVTTHRVGRGTVLFQPLDGTRLVVDRSNEKRTRTERIAPGPLDPTVTQAWANLLAAPAAGPLLSRPVTGDDVEVAARLDRDGRVLLLAVNWTGREATAPLMGDRPFSRGTPEAFRLGPDGRVEATNLPAGQPLRLAPDEVLVARYPRP